MEMKKYKLYEVADYVSSKVSTSQLSLQDYVTTDNLLQNKCGRECAENLPPQSAKVTAYKPGDILVSNIRPYLKKIWYANSEGGNSADVLTIRAKEDFEKLYIYYTLFQDSFFDYVSKGVKGSKMPRGDKNHIMNFEILVPENLQVQKKIASTLSTLDQRIENLRAQNRVLEQTAKTIYDYTFLQCAGHQTTYNKTLNRNIPTNWEVKSVNQMAKSYRGVAYDKSDVQKENNGGILVLRGNNIQDNNLVYDGNVVYIPENLVEDNQHIKKGDIIMTMSSGSKEHIGKCTMFQYDSKHTYGAFLTKFTPKKECRYYFYMNLISEYFKAKIKSVCNGTGINNLTNQTFDEIFFPYPDSKTLDFFEKTVTPVFDKIGVNTKQIETLTTQRNTLLPLLMTGQVTID